LPRTSTAARRRSSQKCMRSSCVRSRGSAPPLRRGAAARQSPPSLCRYADQPLRGPTHLRGSPRTLPGAPRPQTPRGPQAPFVGPSGQYQSVMEALPPNLRCSPAQGLGVVVSKAFSFHTPPPWAAPRGGCASGSRTPPNGTPFNLYRSRGGTKGTPVARPTSMAHAPQEAGFRLTSMGRPSGGAGRGFPYPKSRFLPRCRARTASLSGCVKALENNALRRVFL
jgi:hypothetical protein